MTSTGASRTPRAIPFGKYLLLERLHVGTAAEVFLAKTFGPLEEFDQYAAGFATLKGAVQDGFAAWIGSRASTRRATAARTGRA